MSQDDKNPNVSTSGQGNEELQSTQGPKKAEQVTSEASKGISRRNLLRTAGLVGLGLAADAVVPAPIFAAAEKAGGVAACSPTADGAGRLVLPLNLKNAKSFELLVNSMGDKEVRNGLKANQSLPNSVKDLLRMPEDTKFLELANRVHELYGKHVQGQETLDNVKEKALEFQRYITNMYPDGYSALKEYAMNVTGGKVHTNGWLAVWAWAAANAGGVVNGLVWANAAVATMAIVAVAAVVVVAVVVS